MNKKIDLNKHITEGWTTGSFVKELTPLFNLVQNGSSWQKPFQTKAELKQWCMDNQPYYKNHIPEVVNYFNQFLKLK